MTQNYTSSFSQTLRAHFFFHGPTLLSACRKRREGLSGTKRGGSGANKNRASCVRKGYQTFQHALVHMFILYFFILTASSLLDRYMLRHKFKLSCPTEWLCLKDEAHVRIICKTKDASRRNATKLLLWRRNGACPDSFLPHLVDIQFCNVCSRQ